MSKERFELRRLMDALRDGAARGDRPAPGFVPVHAYQTELEEAITRMLNDWLNPSNTEEAQAVLDRVAAHMHRIIDRDREALGLEAVPRPEK